MKKNLLIKLNDIIVDVSSNYDRAIKKSVEFFMGSILVPNELLIFRQKACPANNLECINRFLNERGLFLREAALIKKFTEYYLGREFEGFIKNNLLLVSKGVIDKLNEKYNLILLSLMPKEETDFILKNLKINKKLKVISIDSVEEGIHTAKRKLGESLIYVGNNIMDYNAALNKGAEFIGLNLVTEKGINIKKIEELL